MQESLFEQMAQLIKKQKSDSMFDQIFEIITKQVETPIHASNSKVSTCCGAESSNTDYDICPECQEHCDFECPECQGKGCPECEIILGDD